MNYFLPDGWEEALINDIQIDVIGGDWGKDVIFDDPEYVHAKVLRGTDFKAWETDRAGNATVRKISISSIKRRKLEVGDIIIEISGGSQEQPVGRSVLIDKLTLEESLPIICSNFFRRLRLSKEVNSHYVYFFLQFAYERGDFIEIQSQSVGLRNLNFNDFLNQTIVPLAPRSEQQRIVTIIDERLKQVVRSRQQFQKLKVELQQYRKDILTSAVSGKLTEDWQQDNFDVEPAEELVEHLIKERIRLYQEQVNKAQQDGKPKPRAPKFDTTLTDVLADYEIPDSWFWTRLLNIANISGGVAKGKDFKKQATISLPYLRVANVQDGYFDLSDVKEIEILPDEKEKYLLHKGDILFTEGGDRDKLGRGAIWQARIIECIHQNHVFKARTLPDFVLPEYISLFTKTDVAKNYFFANATQSINLSSISMTTLGNTPIALPPIEEQKEILKRVAEQMAAADMIEISYDNALSEVEALPQIILAKAFAGELTEQDLNDEPAIDLLERIRIEHERIANAPKPKKDKIQRSKKMAEPKLIEIIQQTFPNQSFTFDELRQKTTKGYDVLRDELYSLIEIDKKVVHQFNPVTETLIFSLTTNENPPN